MTVTENNGHLPPEGPSVTRDDDGPLASLRAQPDNVHAFGGYGPFVVAVILFILMVTLAPTIAPEQVVERPVNAPAVEAEP